MLSKSNPWPNTRDIPPMVYCLFKTGRRPCALLHAGGEATASLVAKHSSVGCLRLKTNSQPANSAAPSIPVPIPSHENWDSVWWRLARNYKYPSVTLIVRHPLSRCSTKFSVPYARSISISLSSRQRLSTVLHCR